MWKASSPEMCSKFGEARRHQLFFFLRAQTAGDLPEAAVNFLGKMVGFCQSWYSLPTVALQKVKRLMLERASNKDLQPECVCAWERSLHAAMCVGSPATSMFKRNMLVSK